MTYALGIFCFLISLSLTLAVSFLVLRDLRNKYGAFTGWIPLAILSVCFTVVLMRPHEHTFQALDSSAYRLMARSFSSGRTLKSEDAVLKELQPDLRQWMLLNPDEQGRLTRDRSFELADTESCRTRPFFYPFLPLCMLGMDLLLPGDAGDFFVPLLGLIFCIVLLVAGIYEAGWLGGVIWTMLFLGSPLPVWLLRGCVLEAPAGILISMVVLAWLIRKPDGYPVKFLHFCLLGLAVSFHPVMLLLVIPVSGIMLFSSDRMFSSVGGCITGLLAGLLPLLLLTLFVCAPYGELSFQNLSNTLMYSSSIRPAIYIGLALIVIFGLTVALRNVLVSKLKGIRMPRLVTFILFGIIWFLPVYLAVRFWENGQGGVVLNGLLELGDGLQYPFGVLLGLVLLYILVERKSYCALFIISSVFAVLPLFLYLKGAENMGLWSQRRLLAPLLIVLVCIACSCYGLVAAYIRRGSFAPAKMAVAVAVLIFAGGSNMCRWPAPYLVSYERGGNEFVDVVRERLGESLVLFDYHSYSLPFAVDGRMRALGLSERGYSAIPDVVKWLAARTQTEDVYIATAYANPGMEDGVILESVEKWTVDLPRVRAKTALPAVKYDKKVDIDLLRLRPVTGQDRPVMHKIFDGLNRHNRDAIGLGMRGAWGRSDIPLKKSSGENVCGQWSREGSGIIGPVPDPGGSVMFNVEAMVPRKDGRSDQLLKIVAPWGGAPVEVAVGNEYSDVSLVLSRSLDMTDYAGRTGVYRIYSSLPYNPALSGIGGFSPDLGFLIHSIRIELQP